MHSKVHLKSGAEVRNGQNQDRKTGLATQGMRWEMAAEPGPIMRIHHISDRDTAAIAGLTEDKQGMGTAVDSTVLL